MLIEIHILKNYPPVNLNRDETGAPKSCFFGGVQRGRISSQCLKRTWRTSDMFGDLGSRGIRTRGMPVEVERRLMESGIDQKFVREAVKKLTVIGNEKKGSSSEEESEKKKEDSEEKLKTKQMIFYCEEELDRIVQSVKSAIEADGNLRTFKARKLEDMMPPEFSNAESRFMTADIALFGRMVTSQYFADVDAAMHVAHAISTHTVNRESDYFTAVDELLKEGAGMLGDIDYNSCCYYEYASLDTDLLRENLKSCPDRDALMEKLIPTLLRVMAFSNPSGKQSTLSGEVMPDVIMVECKKDKIPLSYVNAFEIPVSIWGTHPDIVKNSIRKLAEHVNQMDHAFELPVLHRMWLAPRYSVDHPVRCDLCEKMSALTDACSAWLREDCQ